MWLVSLRKRTAEPRRCSKRPWMASVDPLLVPGRSKYANTSAARLSSVHPSVLASLKVLGTLVLTESIRVCIIARPLVRSGSR